MRSRERNTRRIQCQDRDDIVLSEPSLRLHRDKDVGERTCDRQIRTWQGRPRQSSGFGDERIARAAPWGSVGVEAECKELCLLVVLAEAIARDKHEHECMDGVRRLVVA